MRGVCGRRASCRKLIFALFVMTRAGLPINQPLLQCSPPSPPDETVEERKLAKSVSCGKTFRGRHTLRDLDAVHTWLLELGGWLWDTAHEVLMLI